MNFINSNKFANLKIFVKDNLSGVNLEFSSCRLTEFIETRLR